MHTYTPSRRAATQTERGAGVGVVEGQWEWGGGGLKNDETKETRPIRDKPQSRKTSPFNKNDQGVHYIQSVPGMKLNPQTTEHSSQKKKKNSRHIHTRRLRTAAVTANAGDLGGLVHTQLHTQPRSQSHTPSIAFRHPSYVVNQCLEFQSVLLPAQWLTHDAALGIALAGHDAD